MLPHVATALCLFQPAINYGVAFKDFERNRNLSTIAIDVDFSEHAVPLGEYSRQRKMASRTIGFADWFIRRCAECLPRDDPLNSNRRNRNQTHFAIFRKDEIVYTKGTSSHVLILHDIGDSMYRWLYLVDKWEFTNDDGVKGAKPVNCSCRLLKRQTAQQLSAFCVSLQEQKARDVLEKEQESSQRNLSELERRNRGLLDPEQEMQRILNENEILGSHAEEQTSRGVLIREQERRTDNLRVEEQQSTEDNLKRKLKEKDDKIITIICCIAGAFVVVIAIILFLCIKSRKSRINRMARRMETKFRAVILRQKDRSDAIIMSLRPKDNRPQPRNVHAAFHEEFGMKEVFPVTVGEGKDVVQIAEELGVVVTPGLRPEGVTEGEGNDTTRYREKIGNETPGDKETLGEIDKDDEEGDAAQRHLDGILEMQMYVGGDEEEMDRMIQAEFEGKAIPKSK